uniref:SEA domain-containing protein n=1 Tax=Pygocentrus nattereri TaxID=42514 RepID=A0AAR2K001_PYGNA
MCVNASCNDSGSVLRFVSPTDNIKSCSFIQMMEHRLENVFSEAQEKVEDSYGVLSVEIQNTYQMGNSLTVSLVYVVWNGSTALNGTMASGLMNQLTAELVGYFLFFPPMLIAERKFHYCFAIFMLHQQEISE